MVVRLNFCSGLSWKVDYKLAQGPAETDRLVTVIR